MANIKIYLNDILETKQKGKHLWSQWFILFGFYFEKKFGSDFEII